MNNLTEVDDKQRDLIVLYHNLKGFDGNLINEELYRKDKSLGRCSERSGYAGLEKFCKLEILHYEGMIPDLHYYAEDISEEAEFQAATHCYMCEEDGTKWNADGTKNHCRGTITRLERTFQKVHGSTSTQFDWKYGRRHHPSLSAKFRISIYNINLFLNSV